jgi:AraC-like DNA-binding protein
MHGDPARHWTLQMLAERDGMSRTIFASRFKETVGSPVIEYLSRWRMPLAGDKLRNSDASVAAIALELGYESESASSKAFRREMGRSPRQFSRGHNNRLPTRAGGETPTRKMELVAG